VVNLWIPLTLVNLTIADGYADQGGAIYNSGAVTATNCTSPAIARSPKWVAEGGAIYNSGSRRPAEREQLHLLRQQRVLKQWEAKAAPSSTSQRVVTWDVSNSTFPALGKGSCGAIHNRQGTLTMSNSTFSGNWAGWGGGS